MPQRLLRLFDGRTAPAWRVLLAVLVMTCAPLGVTAPASAQDSFYVRTTGDDANTGRSADRAFRTITRASQVAGAGDVVHVGAGTYDEQLTPVRSGTSGNPIRYIADTGGTQTGDVGAVILRHTGSGGAVRFSSRSHIRLEGLIIDAGGSGNGVDVTGSTAGLVLSGCTVRNAGNHLVSVQHSGSSIRIEETTLSGAGRRGVHAQDGDAVLIGVTIEDVGDRGIHLQNGSASVVGHRVIVRRTGGQGVHAQNGPVTLVDSVIHGTGDDGVYAHNGGALVTLVHAVVAGSAGEALRVENGRIDATNTVLTGSASHLAYNRQGRMTLTHCVLDQTGRGGITRGSITQTNVTEGGAGLTDPVSGDFTPGPGAAVLDAGADVSSVYASLGLDPADLGGNDRPQGAGYDIGAYEGAGRFAAAVPYRTGFDGTPGAEWSDGRVASSSSLGRFLGRFGMENRDPHSETVLALATTPGEPYVLTFDLNIIDTWDATGRYTDHFRVAIDGSVVLDHTFDPRGRGQTYPYRPDVSGRNLGFGRHGDAVFRAVTIEFVASSDVTVIAFQGESTGDLSGESWGIDNVAVGEISTVAAPTPYATGFDARPGYEWDERAVNATGSSLGNMLGPFAAETPTLTVETVPGRDYTLYLDLFAFDGWAGQAFAVSVDGTEVVRDALHAARPGALAGLSASEIGALARGNGVDLVYRYVRMPFTARDETTAITFAAGLDAPATPGDTGSPSWGLGQVVVTDSDRMPGLSARWVYTPRDPRRISDIDWSTGFRESIEDRVDFADTRGSFYPGGPSDRFGLWLRGTVEIPEGGEWAFTLRSDDGSRLWIDGAEVVNNDGLHSPRSRTGRVTLAPGFYPIELKWFERDGRANLELFWDGPGAWSNELVPARYLSRPLPTFVDISAGTGFGLTTASRAFDDRTAPLLFGDLNGDGWLDALAGGDRASVLLGSSAGTYRRFLLPGARGAYGGAGFFDADRDGDLDLWSARDSSDNNERLWQNDALGNLSDMGAAGLSHPRGNVGVALGDLNADGWTDVTMLSRSGTTVGLHSRAVDPDDGPWFERDTSRLDDLTGPGARGVATHAATGDINNDGVPDLFSVRSGGSLYLSNRGADEDGDAVPDPPAHRLAALGVSLPRGVSQQASVAFVDYDNDGDLDLWVGSGSSAPATLWRRGPSGFADVTASAGLAGITGSRASAWGDIDNDGRLDLFVSIAGGPDRLYRGTGAGFTLTDEPMLASTDHADNAVFVDFDNDRDLDLAVLRPGGTNALFENLRDNGRGLLVEVVGRGRVAPDAVGTRVELLGPAGTLLGRRDVGAATGSGSQWPLRLHFGVTDPGATHTLRVTWPGGRRTEHPVVPASASATSGGTTVPGLVVIESDRDRMRMVRWREMDPDR